MFSLRDHGIIMVREAGLELSAVPRRYGGRYRLSNIVGTRRCRTITSARVRCRLIVGLTWGPSARETSFFLAPVLAV